MPRLLFKMAEKPALQDVHQRTKAPRNVIRALETPFGAQVAFVRLVEEGPLDYLTLDYLAEVTMSIMQKLKGRDPQKGYATDFVSLLERILPTLVAKDIKVIATRVA